MNDIIRDSKQRARALAQHIITIDPVFFDTETTGVDGQSEIVEISACDLKGNVLLDQLIRPIGPYSTKVQEINGITELMLRSKPVLASVWNTVRTAFTARHLVAYNANFDMRMLTQSATSQRAISRPGINYYSLTDAMLLLSDWFCTPGQYGNYKWYKLGEAAVLLEVEVDSTLHRALADCSLLAKLVQRVAEMEITDETQPESA